MIHSSIPVIEWLEDLRIDLDVAHKSHGTPDDESLARIKSSLEALDHMIEVLKKEEEEEDD